MSGMSQIWWEVYFSWVSLILKDISTLIKVESWGSAGVPLLSWWDKGSIPVCIPYRVTQSLKMPCLSLEVELFSYGTYALNIWKIKDWLSIIKALLVGKTPEDRRSVSTISHRSRIDLDLMEAFLEQRDPLLILDLI